MESAANELNIGALIPDLGTVMGFIKLLFCLAVLAGPVIMLVFGRIFRDNPPKEANYSVGYRFWWGMASLEAWTFTQKLAGKLWTIAGSAMTGVAAVVCIVILFLKPMAMAWTAVIFIILELAAVAAVCITINTKVMKTFDKDGYLREESEN